MRVRLHGRKKVSFPSSQSGLSLIEVLLGMTLMTVGLVGMLSVFSFALTLTGAAQQDQIGKQLASEALESIFTARETADLSWNQIQNVEDGGVFVSNYQSIHESGADYIFGTPDDIEAPARVLSLLGSDGILGTADDRQMALTKFKRKIEIAPVQDSSSLRLVTITVQYPAPAGVLKSYVLTTYISQFR